MAEKEFIYEIGLTPDDKQRLMQSLGVTCLSLEDYGNVKEQINSIEVPDSL